MIRDSFLFNFEYIIRILVSVCCGIIIGYERTSKHKEAGVRTHVIVAVSSALMMIISKYGFSDVDKYDASRIASQIVSGVGFLGAGIIFVKDKLVVSGLTTAAGIWATAGVGMAIGSGLYVLGLISTIILIISNIFLNNVVTTVRMQKALALSILFKDETLAYEFDLKHFLEYNRLRLLSLDKISVENGVKYTLRANYFVDEFDINRIEIKLNEISCISEYKYDLV